MATTSDSAKATWAVASLPSSVTYVLSAAVFACAIVVVATVIRRSSMDPLRDGPTLRLPVERATDVPSDSRDRRGTCQDTPSIDSGTWGVRLTRHEFHDVAAVGRRLGDVGHRGPSRLPLCQDACVRTLRLP